MLGVVVASLTAQVEEAVTRMIVTRALEPGERIKEAELAAMFGTSRVPVREALRQLSERGLVVHERRRGYHVRALTLKEVDDIFATRLALDRLAVEQASRRPDIAIHAAELATPLDDLAAALKTADVGGVIEADLAFHRAVATLSSNDALVKVYSQVTDPIRPALVQIVPSELDANLVEQHQRIADAILAGDAAAAEIALKAHNNFALNLVRVVMAREVSHTPNHQLSPFQSSS
jgi:DNA-binding GntR family transcriptional regulator